MRFVLIIMVLCASTAQAIVIQEVFVDPQEGQSSEAVLLYNPLSTPQDISNWYLATGTSLADARVPQNTQLCPGCTYLIADPGFNRTSDLNTSITLVNSNSGVALFAENNSRIDAVGWGDRDLIPEELYSGTPTTIPTQGLTLRRIERTGNNTEDFIETEPLWTAPPKPLASIEIPIALKEPDLTITNHQVIVNESITLNIELRSEQEVLLGVLMFPVERDGFALDLEWYCGTSEKTRATALRPAILGTLRETVISCTAEYPATMTPGTYYGNVTFVEISDA